MPLRDPFVCSLVEFFSPWLFGQGCFEWSRSRCTETGQPLLTSVCFWRFEGLSDAQGIGQRSSWFREFWLFFPLRFFCRDGWWSVLLPTGARRRTLKLLASEVWIWNCSQEACLISSSQNFGSLIRTQICHPLQEFCSGFFLTWTFHFRGCDFWKHDLKADFGSEGWSASWSVLAGDSFAWSCAGWPWVCRKCFGHPWQEILKWHRQCSSFESHSPGSLWSPSKTEAVVPSWGTSQHFHGQFSSFLANIKNSLTFNMELFSNTDSLFAILTVKPQCLNCPKLGLRLSRNCKFGSLTIFWDNWD